MATIIDGKQLAKKIRANLRIECEELKKQGINPKLAVIMVGDNPASKVYVKNKSRVCNEVGIEYQEYLLPENATQKELLELIKRLIELTLPIRENNILIDPFLGSGTTAVACKMLGVPYLGIEICQDYIDIANRRLVDMK